MKKENLLLSAEEIKEIVFDMVHRSFGIEKEKITLEFSFKKDVINYDILNMYELIAGLENKFNFDIPPQEVCKIKTVQDFLDLVKYKIVYKGFVEVLCKCLGGEIQVKPHSSLLDDFGADSIDRFEVLIKTEERFGIELNEDEFKKSVDDIEKIINLIVREKYQ